MEDEAEDQNDKATTLENMTPRMHEETARNWREDMAEDLNDQVIN